jgi:DNA modification methylase
MTAEILNGDCIEMMKTLPDRSVNCCVTSPPYFGLRDYGHEGQIGLEETPDAYVAKLVAVFREVKRLLRDDGTLWLNLGDSYVGATSQHKEGGSAGENSCISKKTMSGIPQSGRGNRNRAMNSIGLTMKQLIGIPWRVAFALQSDGWYLRQDIIWHKPNPMPESVTDRCTKAHEYIFLLSKSARYFYDAEAIKEPSASSSIARLSQPNLESQVGSARVPGKTNGNMKAVGGEMRNPRSVWTVNTQPYKGAHFATFPLNLIRPCILAGCPAGGTVLDPFGGSGTTGQVAMEEGRKSILCELNPEYVQLMNQRLNGVTPSLWSQPMEALK